MSYSGWGRGHVQSQLNRRTFTYTFWVYSVFKLMYTYFHKPPSYPSEVSIHHHPSHSKYFGC